MRSLMIVSLFLSLPAFACPNLAGTYKECRSTTGNSEGETNILVEQKIVNKFHVFTITATDNASQERTVETITADGKTRTETQSDDETGITITSKQTASCANNVLTIKALALVNDQEAANITMKVTKSGTKMTQVVSGTSMGETISDTIICE